MRGAEAGDGGRVRNIPNNRNDFVQLKTKDKSKNIQ